MSISSLLSVAGSALLSQQTAINVTGANIANVNTAGYSRQQAVLSAVGSVDAASGYSRLGVEVTGIQRAYDQFLADRIMVQQQNLGYAEARKNALEGVQVIFNDSSGALGNATVGTKFSSAKISFLLTAGSTAFINTDAFTVATLAQTYSDITGATIANPGAVKTIARTVVNSDKIGRYIRPVFDIGGTDNPSYLVGITAYGMQN